MVANPYIVSKSSKIRTVNSPIMSKKYMFSPPNISATSKNRLQYQKFKPFAPGVKLALNSKKESIQNEYYNT